MKTNAARILDQKKIAYRMATYEVDVSDLSAPSVAKKVGMPPAQVFKTLVVRGDKTGVFLVMISADEALDLKAAAQASGNKRIELVALKEVLPLTGYIRGGVSPIGAKRLYPVVIDEACILFDEIAFSAGTRGAQIITSPESLPKIVSVTIARISKEPEYTHREG
jgi:Cys-tRNA(Pro)/Cys-tRNA(Cys) deacylase